MRYDFLIETYATERMKVVSVWSEFKDDDLPVRPRAGDPRGRSRSQRQKQRQLCVQKLRLQLLLMMTCRLAGSHCLVENASESSVFCSISCALEEPVDGLALAERFTERTGRSPAIWRRRGNM